MDYGTTLLFAKYLTLLTVQFPVLFRCHENLGDTMPDILYADGTPWTFAVHNLGNSIARLDRLTRQTDTSCLTQHKFS